MIRKWIVGTALLVTGLTAIAAGLVFVYGIRQPLRWVERVTLRETPHERYARALADAGLGDRALVRDWLAASREALSSATAATLPLERTVGADPAVVEALGFEVTLERGQRLEVTVAFDILTEAVAATGGDAGADGAASAPRGDVFIDLFGPDLTDPAGADALASAAEGSGSLAAEIEATGRYIVRIQPELLRGGTVRVTATPAPSLEFPVSGVDAAGLQSLFGDPRDAGRRAHEGVDIFADRGTLVLAASDGLVTRVGDTNLGGQVVWVWDPLRGLMQYYAHLDEQRVTSGQRVSAGDVIGTVGNTGNARTTPPHLHFGIYEPGGGAIDPAPFIRPAP